MKRIFFILFLILIFVRSGFSAKLPKHWHESGGFACDIKAGLDGKVIKVTNLKSSGAGSLRDALSQSGKRLIVFKVGGVIDLEGKNLRISKGDVTIAGQTAPSPGITLIKGDVGFNASNIVMSHITSRLGTKVGGAYDAMGIYADNVVLDHVAASWSADECISIKNCKNVTLYKTMVTEAMSVSIHPEGEHSKGSLIQSVNNTSFIGTLYAHNALRNPRLQRNAQVALINGVIYNWFPGADDEGAKRFNYVIHMHRAQMAIVGVTGLQGPQSVGDTLVAGHKTSSGKAYMKDNLIMDPTGKPLTEYNKKNITALDEPPLWPAGVEVIPTKENFYEVLRTVGPRPGDREAITARVIKTVADGTGEIVHNEEQVGGYPKYKETRHTVNVPDGFAARRAWLDSLEDAMAVDTKLDLSRLYGIVGTKEDDKYASSETKVTRKTINTDNQLTHNFYVKNNLHVNLTIPADNTVSLKIVDFFGRSVVQTSKKHLPAGSHKLAIDVNQISRGLYICQCTVGNTVINRMFRKF